VCWETRGAGEPVAHCLIPGRIASSCAGVCGDRIREQLGEVQQQLELLGPRPQLPSWSGLPVPGGEKVLNAPRDWSWTTEVMLQSEDSRRDGADHLIARWWRKSGGLDYDPPVGTPGAVWRPAVAGSRDGARSPVVRELFGSTPSLEDPAGTTDAAGFEEISSVGVCCIPLCRGSPPS
jgi:hypothetical protein